MFYPYLFRLKEGNIPGHRSRNSMIMTCKSMYRAIFFTFTVFSLILKHLRYPQNCNIFFRQNGQLTCLTKLVGKHPRTHGQKNYALSSNLEGCPEFFVKVLTSLMDCRVSKALEKFSAPFFLTKYLKFPLVFTWVKEVHSKIACSCSAQCISCTSIFFS